MTGRQKWASEWAAKYSESPAEFEESGQREAFHAGLSLGLEKAASLVGAFPWEGSQGLATLIREIGKGYVGDSL